MTIARNRWLHTSGVLSLALGLLLLGLAAVAWGSAAPAHAQASPTLLSGYVLNYKGEFVAGATIQLYSMPAHTPVGGAVTTDANGQWSLDTGAGTFAVRATAAGYEFGEQTVYATSYQTGITFILRGAAVQEQVPLVATLTGHVYSLNDVPLGGMNIVATNARDTGVKQVLPPPVLSAAVTGGDGSYSIGVPAGTVWLTLKTGAAWGYQLNPMNIVAGQNMANVDFRAAIRVLPRLAFPTDTPAPLPTAAPTAAPAATATPSSNTGGVIGMPTTGAGTGAGGTWALLGLLGLLATAAGAALTRAARPAR